MPEAFSHCHCCGTGFSDKAWPRTCSGCGHMQWHNPLPIGVLIQTVTDGDRVGVLTPIRGHNPMSGYPALTGGFQEAQDHSSEDAGARELEEEVQVARPNEEDIELLVSRACGPFTPPGRRQNLVFSVNPKPMHVSAFDGFVPDDETLAIEFSWEPRLLAFPMHTFAMAKFFQRYLKIEAPDHMIQQPLTGGTVYTDDEMITIYDVPYYQEFLEKGMWTVLFEEGGKKVPVVQKNGRWTCA